MMFIHLSWNSEIGCIFLHSISHQQELNYRFADCILGAGEIRWNLGEAQLCEWGYCVCQMAIFDGIEFHTQTSNF